VLSEGRPEYYQEFITMYPQDPLCDHIRWLLSNLLLSQAWHQAVLANSPIGYKAFYDSYGNSPYAQIALKLEAQPKLVPLMQATKFLAPQNIAPTLKIGNLGQPKYMPLIQQGNGGSQINTNLPIVQKPVDNIGKIVTLPAPIKTTTNNDGIGKIVTLPVASTTQNTGNANSNPGKVVSMPVTIGKGGSTVEVRTTDVKTTNVQTQNQSIRVNNDVKLNNNPVNKVQAQNSQQNNRAQFAINRIVSGGGNNVRQSMNQSPSMNGGNDRRGSFLH
jgi:hypothetical protein